MPVRTLSSNRRGEFHRNRAAMRKPDVRSQDRARTSYDDRHGRHTRFHCRRERAHVKRQQPRHARERALRKEQHRLAALQQPGDPLCVLHTSRCVEAIDEACTDALEKKTREELLRQFALNDERELRRQGGHQCDTIEVARVIADEHTGPRGKVLETSHGERYCGQPEQQPCGAAHRAPAQLPRRNQDDRRPHQRREHTEHASRP